MTTRIRAAAALAAALAVVAGLTACAEAEPASPPAQTPAAIAPTTSAMTETPIPSESPVADPSPCGSGGAHGDENISGYVTDVLGVPVVDTWAGIVDEAAIVCIGVADDDGSIQRAIDAEFGEGMAYVVSMFPRSEVTATTRSRMTVIDDGERPPQLCVTADEPLPPQCEGVDLVGWDWGSVDGAFEEQSGVRWGEYFVTGTYSFDTDELTVDSATADGPDLGFAWDGATGSTCPDGSETIPEEFRPIYDEMATQIIDEKFGVQSYWTTSDGCGNLAIGVAFDDGRIQQAFGEKRGEGSVIIVPLLRETE